MHRAAADPERRQLSAADAGLHPAAGPRGLAAGHRLGASGAAAGGPHSAVMLFDLISAPYLANCARVAVPSSSGELPRGVSPRATSFSRTSESASAFCTSVARRCVMAPGVPAGAIIANHELNSNPGRPDSDTVGTSGNCGRRFGVVTPMSRSLPAFTSELTVAMPWKAPSTSLPATPIAACVAPL